MAEFGNTLGCWILSLSDTGPCLMAELMTRGRASARSHKRTAVFGTCTGLNIDCIWVLLIRIVLGAYGLHGAKSPADSFLGQRVED